MKENSKSGIDIYHACIFKVQIILQVQLAMFLTDGIGDRKIRKVEKAETMYPNKES